MRLLAAYSLAILNFSLNFMFAGKTSSQRLRGCQIYAGNRHPEIGGHQLLFTFLLPESRRCVCTYCAIVAVSVSSVLRWPGPGSESACCCPIPGSRLSGNKDGLLAQISAIACTHQAGYTLELRTIHRFPQSPRRPMSSQCLKGESANRHFQPRSLFVIVKTVYSLQL